MAESTSMTAAALVGELGPGARLASGTATATARIDGVTVWTDGAPPPADPATAIVLARADTDAVHALAASLDRSVTRSIVLCGPVERADPAALRPHAVILTDAEAADVIVAVTRATTPAEQSVARRLTSAQRSLNLSLSAPDPIDELLGRLQRLCNATVVLLDADASVIHATGPAPLGLLAEEILRTDTESQRFAIDGWSGIAVRTIDPTSDGVHSGWIVATARRPGFPDEFTTAAVFVAAGLAEATRTMRLVASRQEIAIRTAVFEEVLALRSGARDPELLGRARALGLDFATDPRVIVIRPAGPSAPVRSGELPPFAHTVSRAFQEAGLQPFATMRGSAVVLLAQCGAERAEALVRACAAEMPEVLLGLGRPTTELGDLVDSHHDAEMAVRLVRRPSHHGATVLRYEDFDYATRLLSDVGLDRMVARAREMLRPLEERPVLLQGLRSYFQHDHNISASADELGIHQNSLRYRLAKVEELLDVSLREPAVLASLFLALTALDLGGVRTSPIRGRPGTDDGPTTGASAADSAATHRPRRDGFGVGFDGRG